MKTDDIRCVYCGDRATDWDHLYPLVSKKRPTGYYHHVRNLVPSCGPCNQSKGGQEWRRWLAGDAKGSPKQRGITDIDVRKRRLEAFENWGAARQLDLPAIIGEPLWSSYWARLSAIEELMIQAQAEAEAIRNKIAAALADEEIGFPLLNAPSPG